MPEVRLSRRAIRDLDSLLKRTARRIVDALEGLAEDPRSARLDVRPLVGRRPWRRLRVGNHGVLFRSAEGGSVLLVGRVVDRKELERAIPSLPE